MTEQEQLRCPLCGNRLIVPTWNWAPKEGYTLSCHAISCPMQISAKTKTDCITQFEQLIGGVDRLVREAVDACIQAIHQLCDKEHSDWNGGGLCEECSWCVEAIEALRTKGKV